MKVIESAGKTREEAIQNGLRELGVDMHDIEKIDVIDEGSKGFLGIGARPVRIRLTAERADEPPRRGSGNRQERPEGRGGNRHERSEGRGGNQQERQGRRGDGRNEHQERPTGGKQEQRGERQEKRQDASKPGGDVKRSNDSSQQSDRPDAQRRKKKRKRSGAPEQDNRDERNAADNRSSNQNRQKQGNAHKASPVAGRKNMSVTDEATEALRRAENFENNIADDEGVMIEELPPNARQDDAIETITDEQGKEAAAMLSEVLGLMELNGNVSFARASDGSARLAIDSEADGGILIGKRGVTLHAIQYLINRMIAQNEAADNTERVIVDVGGYVDRRHDTLADMAKTMARRAKESGRNVRLKPLSPQERRIVHLTLEPDPHVRTYSLGDSLFRSIVINPVGGRSGGQNRRDRGPRDHGPRDRGPHDRNRNAGTAHE